MAALVTSPPIEVDPVKFSRQSTAEINPMGPFKFDTDLYLVLSPDGPPLQPNVFRSTDNGVTWTPQDTSNAPAVNSDIFWVDFNEALGIIGILYADAVPEEALINFDCNTNTYGSPVARGSLFGGGPKGAMYSKAAGDHVFLLHQNSAGGPLSYEVITGSWSGLTLLANIGTGKQLISAAVDPADRGHFAYGSIGSSVSLTYAQVDAAFALSGTTVIGTYDGTTGTLAVSGSNVAIAFTNYQTVYVAIGTPLGGPAFTTYTIETVAGASTVTYATIAVDKDGNFVVFWIEVDYSGGTPVDRLWMSTFNGTTWGAKILFYDEVANPASDSIADQYAQFIHTGQALQLSDGTWIFATAMETTTGGITQFCTGFILRAPGSTPGPPGRRPEYIHRRHFPGD